jgi:hypothetical protein
MSDKDDSYKHEVELAELKLQMIELDGRLNALVQKYKRDRSTSRVLTLQFTIALLALIFLAYLILAPYLGVRSPFLPYFLQVVTAFVAALSGYWAYQTYIKLRLYFSKRAQISEVITKVETIKHGAVNLLGEGAAHYLQDR